MKSENLLYPGLEFHQTNLVNKKMSVKLQELLIKIKDYVIRGKLDVEITGLNFDSRKVSKGNLFFCLEGLNSDGHSFAKEAVKNGAIALMVTRWIDGLNDNVTQVKVSNARYSMGVFSAQFYNQPSEKMTLIAITGTNGKSTTAQYLKSIASAAGQSAGLIGTLGIFIESERQDSSNTTPESPDIQFALNKMVSKGVKFCAMEVSSHAIDLFRYVGCKFDAVIFTNLSQDHLDYHKNMEEYFKTKLSLFQDKYCKKNNAINVINIDDLWGKRVLQDKSIQGEKIGFTLEDKNKDAVCMGKVTEIGLDGTKVLFYNNNKPQVEVDIKLPGIFNVYNALIAATTCFYLNFSKEDIKRGIEIVDRVPGRCDQVMTDRGFSVIVDYAHTPDGLKNLLLNMKQLKKGNLIVVFGCGGNRDKEKRPIMGGIAQKLSDYTIITSDNPRYEKPIEIINEIKKGISVWNNVDIIEDRKKAIFKAIQIARINDIVVIAGKGHEQYQEVNGTRHHFDDKEIAREALRALEG